MITYCPDKGDIIWLDFHPGSGKEIIKKRPAFVISRAAFNQHTGMAIVAPITSTVRGIKLEVILPVHTKTQGSILIYQLKSLDLAARNAQFIEKAPNEIIIKVTDLSKILIQ